MKFMVNINTNRYEIYPDELDEIEKAFEQDIQEHRNDFFSSMYAKLRFEEIESCKYFTDSTLIYLKERKFNNTVNLLLSLL